MADGEVKIHVSADADTTAIDDAARKVDAVKGKAQNATEANPRPATPAPEPKPSVAAAGWESLEKRRQELLQMRREQKDLERGGDTKGARDLGRRADALEKGIDREGARLLKVEEAEAKRAELDRTRESKARSAEERTAARERLQAERAATREIKEQQAMRRAGITTAADVFSVGQGVVTGNNTGASAGGGLMQLAMMAKNPLLIGGAALIAGAIGIKGILDQETDKDTAQTIGLLEKSGGRGIVRRRQASIFGSSASMISSALDKEDEISQRQNARAGIAERAREKWHDPSSWTWFGLRKNAGQREQEVNEAEIKDLERQRQTDLQGAQRKWMGEEGGLQLEQLRGRAKRSQEGHQEAFVAEMAQQWLAEYKSALANGGSAAVAKEMADLTVANNLRDRQSRAGAGLVDARSGGAEVAAAARWSMGALPGMDQVAARIDTLHTTVQQGNQMGQLAKLSK